MAPAQWAGSSQRSLLLRCRDWLDSRRGCWLEPLLPICVGVERTSFRGRDLQSRWIGFPGWELKRSIGLGRLDCEARRHFADTQKCQPNGRQLWFAMLFLTLWIPNRADTYARNEQSTWIWKQPP